MAGVDIGRKRWRSTGGAINWSHPLAAGLETFVSGGVAFVGGRIPTKSGNVEAAATPYGLGMALPAASSSYMELPIVNADKFVGPVTSMWVGKQNNQSTFRAMLGVSINPAGDRTAIDALRYADGHISVTRGGDGVGGRTFREHNTATDANVSGRWDCIIIGFPDNLMQTSPTIMENGAVLANTPAGSGSGAVSSTSTAIRIGRRPDGAVQTDGVVAVTAIWSRCLSVSEMHQLYADPFCMLKG